MSVVLSRLLLEEEISSSQRFQISRNAEGVGAMRLGQAKSNALVLRQIAVGVLDRQTGMRLAHAVQQCPTHDAHEGFRPERMTALDLQLDLSCVISLVACLAQRDQVVWRITARFPTLKMMHVEDLVPRTTMTVLANMTVSEKNVLAHVPESKLVALLIARPFDFGIPDLLNVEGCGFNHDLGDGKQSADRIDARHVRLNAVFNGRCKPSLVFRSDTVQKARRTVARLAMTSITTQ